MPVLAGNRSDNLGKPDGLERFTEGACRVLGNVFTDIGDGAKRLLGKRVGGLSDFLAGEGGKAVAEGNCPITADDNGIEKTDLSFKGLARIPGSVLELTFALPDLLQGSRLAAAKPLSDDLFTTQHKMSLLGFSSETLQKIG